MEAPSGFEPEMEVLQIGPESLSCSLALLAGRPYFSVLPGNWALLFPRCSRIRKVSLGSSDLGHTLSTTWDPQIGELRRHSLAVCGRTHVPVDVRKTAVDADEECPP